MNNTTAALDIWMVSIIMGMPTSRMFDKPNSNCVYYSLCDLQLMICMSDTQQGQSFYYFSVHSLFVDFLGMVILTFYTYIHYFLNKYFAVVLHGTEFMGCLYTVWIIKGVYFIQNHVDLFH